MTIQYEFLVWQLNVPVIYIGDNLDFDVWSLDGIRVDIDESHSTTTIRRRVDIF